MQKTLKRKAVKKRLIRVSLVSANVLVLMGVLAFVITSSGQDKPALAVASHTTKDTTAVTPVDKLTSYDVAANLATAVNVPESIDIVNQAQSAQVAVAVSATETGISEKPQVVSTALKSWRDIVDYVVQSGEDVQSIANKFGVTSQSIRWSNNLSSNYVSAGTKLVIPPVNGIVRTVVAGDTPQKLASTYGSNVDKIIQYNDAEQGLVVGRRIIIPDGRIVTSSVSYSYSGSFTPRYSNTGYPWGWCTWYAAAQSGAPSNWGNANTWAYYAGLTPGWTYSSNPRVGAIAQTSRGWAGHVAIVEAVSDDGTMIKYSDMNGLAGWGRVGYSGWAPAATFQHYIYRT